MSQLPISFKPDFISTPIPTWNDRVTDYTSDEFNRPNISFRYDFAKDLESSSDLFTWDEHATKNSTQSVATPVGGHVSPKKSRRKPSHPCKSPTHSDPKFQGVSFRVRTKMKQENSHLAISFCYRY